MNAHAPCAVEIEFSKKWAAEHAALFAQKFIAFVDEHPEPDWSFSMTVTGGFFTVRAALAKATGGAA